MGILKHAVIKYIFILLLSFWYGSLFADNVSNNDNNYLNVARTQLNIAFENHNKGDIKESKRNLEHASEWLNMAVNHSYSDTVKTEAQKLAKEIDSFRATLNKSSEKNDIARFWHKTTSLIKRESEHLIHGYAELSNNNRILRHLLDAKMHFYTAEHDLFSDHDSNDAGLELKKSIRYLAEAESLSKLELKSQINHLITSVNEIISLLESRKNAWKKGDLIHYLENAEKDLNEAESVASPSDRMRIELIKYSIVKLKNDTLLTSLKGKYDLVMKDFSRAIKNI